MKLVMDDKGQNQFKVPDVKKSPRLCPKEDIETMYCDEDTVDTANSFQQHPEKEWVATCSLLESLCKRANPCGMEVVRFK